MGLPWCLTTSPGYIIPGWRHVHRVRSAKPSPGQISGLQACSISLSGRTLPPRFQASAQFDPWLRWLFSRWPLFSACDESFQGTTVLSHVWDTELGRRRCTHIRMSRLDGLWSQTLTQQVVHNAVAGRPHLCPLDHMFGGLVLCRVVAPGTRRGF